MSGYQLYFREPATGRLIDRRGLSGCHDDKVAVREMVRAIGGADVELWDHGRLVAALPARRGGSAAASLWQRLKDWLAGRPLSGMAA